MTRYLAELALDLVNGFRSARRMRAMIATMQAEEARLDRIKARIVGIGGIEVVRRGSQIVGVRLYPGWEFHADEPIPELRLDMNGVERYMGYTPAELAEIHARRAEYV